ncbi:Reverse transcriptase domain-containing protein [Aphis craccivora]|uniref:Reverse transcriptase domain-containing protein n=1 Tax=Aphis craccivora TaxID=307492 RepID=A0A6G0Y306_APHCR|nr:Reverse transcriptase domain-containing protein [Aphis craccivora]
MADLERLSRNKQRASVRRDAAASQIEAIYNLGLNASTDSSSRSKFLIAADELEGYWSKFILENDTMLEAMIELGTDNEFSNNVELEVRSTLINAKSLTQQFRTSSGSVTASEVSHPEKPSVDQMLPKWNQCRTHQRLQNWPDFRDRFITPVDQKAHLTNIEKFYYLLGCLQSGPTDVVKVITVSDATYGLAWSALVNRYDKPRKLATTLVSEMLNAACHQQESPIALISFLNKFGENIALLRSLNIPDLGSFLLFAIAVRCLPSTSRRLFEQDNTLDFPTVDGLLVFIKDRVEVLENAGTTIPHSTGSPGNQPGVSSKCPIQES